HVVGYVDNEPSVERDVEGPACRAGVGEPANGVDGIKFERDRPDLNASAAVTVDVEARDYKARAIPLQPEPGVGGRFVASVDFDPRLQLKARSRRRARLDVAGDI